jgi:hypothetical protein
MGVNGVSRELHPFELEPEVREWLDNPSDSDFKRVDELCGDSESPNSTINARSTGRSVPRSFANATTEDRPT